MGAKPEALGARQLTLDLGHRTALGREDFVVGPSNAAAVAWLDRWPDWPGGGLVLWGAPGSGKSHLAAVWRGVSGARGHPATGLGANAGGWEVAPGNSVLVEDADPPFDERALLHLFNEVIAGGGRLLITARRPFSECPPTLPDLASRLRALPAVRIADPDDDLLAVVLLKLFADRQVEVEVGVIAYLVARMERSFDAARRLVARIDEVSLSERRPVGRKLAADVLRELGES